MNMYFAFVLIPVADVIVGKDSYKKQDHEEATRPRDR